MKKLNLILDTDVGSDCDDMMAIAYLVYATRRLNTDIKAITHSNGNTYGIPVIRAFFKSLGEVTPPIGKAAVPMKSYDDYAKQVAEKFADKTDYKDAPNAVSVLRQALTESDKAVICAIGPMTNISELLKSNGDSISPLDGISLVKEKCEKIVVMAGRFDLPETEWNVRVDIPAANTLVRLSPVPIVFAPFELGIDMITGRSMMKKCGEDNPLSMSFQLHGGVKKRGGQHSFDPVAALYAVEGCGEYLEESASGKVTVDDTGITTFNEEKDGLHSVITLRKKDRCPISELKAMTAKHIDDAVMTLYEHN